MGKTIIYSNPSNDPILEKVYKEKLKDPSFKPSKGGTFNVNTMKKASRKEKNTKNIDPFNNIGRNA